MGILKIGLESGEVCLGGPGIPGIRNDRTWEVRAWYMSSDDKLIRLDL